MRKTITQLLVLVLAGVIIFWREWVVTATVGNTTEKYVPTDWDSSISASPVLIVWLIVLAGGFVVLTELVTRYFKLSSPNSV